MRLTDAIGLGLFVFFGPSSGKMVPPRRQSNGHMSRGDEELSYGTTVARGLLSYRHSLQHGQADGGWILQ